MSPQSVLRAPSDPSDPSVCSERRGAPHTGHQLPLHLCVYPRVVQPPEEAPAQEGVRPHVHCDSVLRRAEVLTGPYLLAALHRPGGDALPLLVLLVLPIRSVLS